MMGWFWTKDEGGFFAIDKLGHFILHFALVSVLILLLKVYPGITLMISWTAGFLYEWLWDCNFVAIFTGNAHGASKKDLLANTLGGVAGIVACELLFTLP